jgi:hypothetical protein
MKNPDEQVSPYAKRLVSSRGVTARYGDISLRTLDRWIARGVVPKPDRVIAGRRYWHWESLEQADRRNTAEAGATAQTVHSHPP